MKRALLEILACPLCGSYPLQLESCSNQDTEITEGILLCKKCDNRFNIIDKIPRMIANSEKKIDGNIADAKESALDNKDELHNEIRAANIEYYDLVGESFEQDKIQSVHQKSYNQTRIESAIKKLASDSTGQYFLDLGCGTGNLLKYGKKYFNNAVGVDVSIGLLKQASMHGLDVIQADVMALPFRKETFDAISLFSVLHHIYDYPEIFKIAGKLLKSNAFFYSDWDPQQAIKSKSVLVKLIYVTYFLLRRMKIIREIDSDINRDHDLSVDNYSSDIRRNNPRLNKIIKLAEYHEQSKERGLDPELIKEVLSEAGFSPVKITGHWQGKTFEQLNLSKINKMEFIWLSQASGQPVDRFMENIKVIAQKV